MLSHRGRPPKKAIARRESSGPSNTHAEAVGIVSILTAQECDAPTKKKRYVLDFASSILSLNLVCRGRPPKKVSFASDTYVQHYCSDEAVQQTTAFVAQDDDVPPRRKR